MDTTDLSCPLRFSNPRSPSGSTGTSAQSLRLFSSAFQSVSMTLKTPKFCLEIALRKVHAAKDIVFSLFLLGLHLMFFFSLPSFVAFFITISMPPTT